MSHLVLFGDSIFDNQAYVPPNQTVIDHLQALLPANWQATLLAVDGSTTSSIPAQLARLPSDASHLVLSVGGNDAIGQLHIIQEPVENIGEAFNLLYDHIVEFERNYHRVLDAILSRNLPTTICTIYAGWFEGMLERKITSTALRLFNDAIVINAFKKQLPIIDLRLVCAEEVDYANPIEPSSIGGKKIAQAIVSAVINSHITKFVRVYQ